MFEWITRTIESLGYVGVAALTFLENLFPPIPSELVIPLAGFVATQGRFRLDMMIAAASIGSLVGASFWYAVGRKLGERRLRQWIAAHGRWVALSPRDMDAAQAWFKRHGAASVCIGRVVPGVRSLISIPAGISEMPPGRFLFYSAVGTVVWTAALAVAGSVLRANFQLISQHINVISNIVVGGFVVMMLARYYKCWAVTKST